MTIGSCLTRRSYYKAMLGCSHVKGCIPDGTCAGVSTAIGCIRRASVTSRRLARMSSMSRSRGTLMNRQQAEMHAILNGSPLIRCNSGAHWVYCRVLNADEVQALVEDAPIWVTGLSGMDDRRLRHGVVTLVGCNTWGFRYAQSEPVTGWMVFNRGNYYRHRRFLEPLEDDD